ncbi:MAG: hypothetical protein KGJ78_10595 [Alphaproteobacteria bacterium]|nr:hypothetical protein [Alphaproteobacteria bacterium]
MRSRFQDSIDEMRLKNGVNGVEEKDGRPNLDSTAFLVAAILASGIAAGRKDITTPYQAMMDYRGVLSHIRAGGLE